MCEAIQISGLTKRYGDKIVFEQLDAELPSEQINVILGPSGCGKTSLLRLIAGLESFEAGFIKKNTKERISFIFQEHRLLPWKTALQNVEIVLGNLMTTEQSQATACKYLEMVGLQKSMQLYPPQLSGGMKQRVSVARAFAFPSQLILMDEPFKELDIKTKRNLITTIKEVWNKDQRTMLFVTHDVDEAVELGHNIFIMSEIPSKIIRVFDKLTIEKEKLKQCIMKLVS